MGRKGRRIQVRSANKGFWVRHKYVEATGPAIRIPWGWVVAFMVCIIGMVTIKGVVESETQKEIQGEKEAIQRAIAGDSTSP